CCFRPAGAPPRSPPSPYTTLFRSDFQLASRGDPRSRWMRLLFREDLRHLLKHKRMYCREALTPVEQRVLRRNSWVRDLWFRTGKPAYRFVTRRILKWEDNEGQGPKP